MEDSKSIVKQGNPEAPLNVFGSGFERAHEIARALAYSGIVPPLYQGPDNLPNCLIALDIADRTRVGVLAVMQSMYIVHNRPAFDAKFVTAAVNACGRYSPLRTKCNGLDGDAYGYYAYATEISTGEVLIGTTIDWKMVKAEGWDKDKPMKSGGVQVSKWKTMPDQMFKYRAKSFWQKEHDPGLTMGIMTTDEADDITVDIEKVESAPTTLDDVIEANKKRAAEVEKSKEEKQPVESEAQKNKAAEDIQEAKRKQAMETETLRVTVIDKAREKWGDDGMMKLGQLLRTRGTSVAEASLDALNWAMEAIQ